MLRPTKKSLTLKTETIRTLTSSALEGAAGGAAATLGANCSAACNARGNGTNPGSVPTAGSVVDLGNLAINFYVP